jgi:hypothetical protein
VLAQTPRAKETAGKPEALEGGRGSGRGRKPHGGRSRSRERLPGSAGSRPCSAARPGAALPSGGGESGRSKHTRGGRKPNGRTGGPRRGGRSGEHRPGHRPDGRWTGTDARLEQGSEAAGSSPSAMAPRRPGEPGRALRAPCATTSGTAGGLTHPQTRIGGRPVSGRRRQPRGAWGKRRTGSASTAGHGTSEGGGEGRDGVTRSGRSWPERQESKGRRKASRLTEREKL